MSQDKPKLRSALDFVNAAATNTSTVKPEPPAAPVDAVKPALPKPPAPAARKIKPWDGAHPKLKVPFAMRFPERLHIQLAWLAERIPETSMHSIALEAIEKHVAELVKKHDG